ncbi:MAG: hypothetical protein ABIT20_02725 [Gemmatimonadaceae bacterium]
MTMSDIMSCPTMGAHDSRREGVRLGLIVATATWLWVAALDAASGRPFHTFHALGGVVGFTAIHYALCMTYGVVLVTAVHGAAREPSLVLALIFGGILFQVAFAMLTALLAATAVGNVAWPGIFGGSLIGASIAFVLLTQTHPVAVYLRRAESET